MPPDFEALAYERTRHLGGITVFATDGSQEWPGRIERMTVQVDVRASSKKRARDRAYEARDLLLALPGEDWKGRSLVINDVECSAGPMWLPESDGAPRYTLRLDFRGHDQRERK